MGNKESTQPAPTTEIIKPAGPEFGLAERFANWSYDTASSVSHSVLQSGISLSEKALNVDWIASFAKWLFGESSPYILVFLKLLSTYVKDVPPPQLLFGWFILENHLRIPFPVSGKAVTMEDLEEVAYWSRFTLAIYGWKLIQTFISGSLFTVVSSLGGSIISAQKEVAQNIACYQMMTGLEGDTLIHCDWFSSHMAPAHLIAVDHGKQTIVISFRGTMDANDILADLVCESMEWETMITHMGFLACAQNKMKQTEEIVVKAFEDYKYNVVVTGHSLGAAVCTVYGVMLRNKYPAMNVRIFPLACPPCFPLDKARECSEYVTSVVLGSDVVPRLSLGSLHDLKDRILKVLEDNPTFSHQAFRAFAGGSVLGQNWTKELEEQKYGSSKLDMDVMNALKTHDKLYTPGKCLFINGDIYKPTEITCEYIDNECFDEVLIHHSVDMFKAHMPDRYRLFLGACLDVLQKKDTSGDISDEVIEKCNPNTLYNLNLL